MALISFLSAKGAPGVTSTAALVAALWPRPTVLVDADPAGGDLALRLVADNGAPLSRTPSLLTLLPLARHGLSRGTVLEHTQTSMGGQRVLVGVERPEQAEAGAALWPVVAQAFGELGDTDVVVDAGQVLPRSAHLALLQASDLVVGVVRPQASSVVHLRRRLQMLAERFAPLGAQAPRLGVVCVAPVQRQDEAGAAVATITAEVTSVVDLGQVAWDPSAVRMFEGDPIFRPERTMLVRSGRALVDRLVGAAGVQLPPPPPEAAPTDGGGAEETAGPSGPSTSTRSRRRIVR